MSRPRILPDSDSELTRLINKHGAPYVASLFGVTEQAVYKAIQDRKLPFARRVSYKKWIPWTIRAGDADSYLHKRLRDWAQDELGERPLSKKQVGMLRRWKEEMGPDLVVQYDPGHPKGPWLIVPRRPGVDVGYIRNPEVP